MKKFMHDNQHSTYNDWVREARAKDGGRGGEVYKQGPKDMLVPMSKDERVYKSKKYMQQALRDWGLSRLARPATFATGMGVGTAAMAAEDAKEIWTLSCSKAYSLIQSHEDCGTPLRTLVGSATTQRAVAGGLLANELKRSDAPERRFLA